MHKRIRILLVDDEKDFATGLSRLLKAEFTRMEVFTAASGEQALSLLAQTHIPLVVTDLQMPDTDGIALFSRLKRQHPLLRGIACSGFLDYDVTTSLIEAGFDDCLPKPVQQEALLHSVNRSFAIRFHWQERLAQLRGLERRS